MRRHSLRLSFLLLFTLSRLCAQTSSPKVCVYEGAEGYDALRLARELSSRKLRSGASLAVVSITGKALSAEAEQVLGLSSGAPFAGVLLKKQTAKAHSAQLEQLGCNYSIQVSYHESADAFDANSPEGIPSPMPGASPPIGDRTTVDYLMRKAESKRVLARGSAPPLTVFVKKGRRVFNPYSQFADQVVKKLNDIS